MLFITTTPISNGSSVSLPLTEPVYIFCVVLLIIAIAPFLSQLLKLPQLVVLIILGTILGNNVLGIISRDAQLILLEKIGLLYIMLLAGLQMDLKNFKRLGVRSLFFGCLTFGIPLTVGILSGYWLTGTILSSLLLGILYSPHTLVSYPIMTRLGIVQQEAVGVAVGGSIVTSIFTLVGLSIVQAFAGGSVGIWLWIKLLIFLPILAFLCFWVIPKIGQKIIIQNPILPPLSVNGEGAGGRGSLQPIQPPSDNLNNQYIFVLTCLFITASATLLLGIDSIVGAFIAGLALNSLIPLTSQLMKQIEFVGNSLFIPAFMISVGVLSNPRVLFTHPQNLGIALLIIIGAVGAKFLAALIAGQLYKYSLAEIMVMFSLTMSRAALVLVVALFGKNAGILNEGIFNGIIVYIIVTCLASPLIADVFGRQVAEKQQLLQQQVS
ncbi:MAG TPA: cation:proton antiporter [Oculatellaceae cyanobacterium]|jgi:Kef-type K+ transport system membrane component KefB